jgi:hypothetical protein
VHLVVLVASSCDRREHTSDKEFTLSGTSFEGCSSSYDGAAISVYAKSAKVLIVRCTFVKCVRTGSRIEGYIGGGISSFSAQFEVSFCSFSSCSAAYYGACSSVGLSGNGLLACTDDSSVGSTGYGAVWWLSGETPSAGALTFSRSNVSESVVTVWGAVLSTEKGIGLQLEFCEIRSNTGQGVILFDEVTVSSIRCLSVRSNTCRGYEYWRGMFSRHSAADMKPIRDSVIAENSIDYLVGGSGTFTFQNCYFDIFSHSGYGADFVTLECIATNCRGVVPTCVPATETPRESPFPSRSHSPSPTHIAPPQHRLGVRL